MSVFKPVGLAVCLSVLQACGGGGGTSATLQSAPNADSKIQIDYAAYNLNTATTDDQGQVYAKQYDSGSWQSAVPLYFWGQKLTGCFNVSGYNCESNAGPSLAKPTQEVVDAWNLGWTGKGVNILMEDFLYDKEKFHGTITSLIAYRYAPAATLYGLNIAVDQSFQSVVNLANETYNGTPLKLGVVNASYVANLSQLTGKSSGWTEAELLNARVANTANSLLITNRYQDAAYKGQVNYTDAVITKAAGNDKLRAELEPLNKAFANIPVINSRLLIVGALTQAGTTVTPVDMASYSNTAGKDASVNSRFLLASGTVPFADGALSINGTPVQAYSNVGTSYAAPRVAGMVADCSQQIPQLKRQPDCVHHAGHRTL